MAGRRPTPTHLKLVKGNPGKRGINKQEPQPRRTLPSPPDHLSDGARLTWGRLTVLLDRMGVLTEADAYALERLCEIYGEILECQEVIAEVGRTYETRNEAGSVMYRARPEVAMLADADRRFKSYLVEFGLTPAARSKVKVADGEQEADPLQSYFG
ncbi:phage terminase small subunit P27 family [Azospirillum thermophilum]|uniref:Phage terminase small subunit P27 family n=1 Tax=Azospirillum thermophilum TaxID=2202148 RepID=A0A2S2CKS9_9PROT|nr:phage terminase small subunit P27 family [Azospirillum thermophilum]AWK85039.1 phage terminase small subunit P27 family [Azospirillum thermophilum]